MSGLIPENDPPTWILPTPSGEVWAALVYYYQLSEPKYWDRVHSSVTLPPGWETVEDEKDGCGVIIDCNGHRVGQYVVHDTKDGYSGRTSFDKDYVLKLGLFN